QWRGEPLEGKTILLHAEQGFGDVIQFLRYVPRVLARGAKIVVLEVARPLLPLARRIRGITVVARGDPLPAFDTHCPLLSLPRAADLAQRQGAPAVDLAAELTDFDETAAAIAALDLVISADTAVAHLAGALGKPVWVMLPFAPDWRWLIGRDDSPWYPSMRLF